MSGFTLAELMVSIAILIIISLAVVGDITRTRHQEEIASSARLVAATLRSLQSRALAATSVMTCEVGEAYVVCERDDGACAGAPCNTEAVPMAVGATLKTGAAVITTFAEVDIAFEDRREDPSGREYLGAQRLAEHIPGSEPVTIKQLNVGGTYQPLATVTFDRQSGAMRINACGTPQPLTPECGGNPEPTTLEIELEHERRGYTKTISLNAVTGKISVD